MILADKIIKQRKLKGWSQEEFAEMMGVSRQAVSKWESAQSIPEISKILLMASLFGVTTDYLLRDEIEDIEYQEVESVNLCRKITTEEANAYLNKKRKAAFSFAISIAMFILSPISLVILGGFSDMIDSFMSENLAAGIGLVAMFLIVCTGISICWYTEFKNSDYRYLENECFECECGAREMVLERVGKFGKSYTIANIVATVMCVLSPLPIILTGIFLNNDIVTLCMVGVMLFIVAIAVFIFVFVGKIWDSYQILLKNSEYSDSKDGDKKNNKKSLVEDIYWTLVLAVYLIWSFSCSAWAISWIVWVIAAPLSGLIPIIFKSKRR